MSRGRPRAGGGIGVGYAADWERGSREKYEFGGPVGSRFSWAQLRRYDILGIEIIGEIQGVRTIAVGRRIRELGRLKKVYGPGRWRKRKGRASVRLPDGSQRWAEVHWYEAHGVGKKEFKVKRMLEAER